MKLSDVGRNPIVVRPGISTVTFDKQGDAKDTKRKKKKAKPNEESD